MVSREAQAAVIGPPAAAPAVQGREVEDDLSIEYPSSDGMPMAESKRQYTPMTDTVAALENHYLGRNDIFIAGNLLVYYRMNHNRVRVAPDVLVVFGAAGSHPRDSWLVWREGRAPGFVVEIASPSTWAWDAEGKRRIYANMGVEEYWRFDPTGVCFTPPLVGERLSAGRYQELPLHRDGAGMLWGRSEALGLDICVLPGLELRLYDPAEGRWLLTPQESEAGRVSAEAALRVSEAARQASEAELRGAETLLQASEAARRASEAARRDLEAENEMLLARLRLLESGQ